MNKGQLAPKLFSLIVLTVLALVVSSLLFFIMMSLNIKITIDMVYRPIYQPLSSQSLSFSLFSSDLNDKFVEYVQTDDAQLKDQIERTVSSSVSTYKIVAGNKILGNPSLSVNQVYSSYLLSNENKRFGIEVST